MNWLRRWFHRDQLQHTYIAGNQWIEWYKTRDGERHITREYMAEPPYRDPPAPKEAQYRWRK